MAYETRSDDVRMDLAALLGAVLSRWLRILFVTGILLALTYGVLMFVPKLYESSASILVEPRANAYTRPSNEVLPASGGVDESTMSSQVELIKSRDTLLKVIDSENLRSVAEFNGTAGSPIGALLALVGRAPEPKSVDQAVLQTLTERLSVVRERDSRVISVSVRSEDPDLAARLANAIANAHVSRRADLSLADTAEASDWLKVEIDKLRERVNEAETRVANFRSENDLFVGANNTTLLDQQLSSIQTQINAAQERKNTAQSRADLIRGLITAGQPISGVPDVRDSVVIQQLVQTRANLQGELAQRSTTLLPNHPTIQSLRAQVAEIDRQINIEGRRVADALEAEAKIEASLGVSLADDLTRLKVTASTASTSTVTLEDLQREAKAQRDLLENYLARYRDASSRSESSGTLPDVRVVSEAAPSTTPASPKTAFIMAAVGIGALALQVGTVFFAELLSGRALVERNPLGRIEAAQPLARLDEVESEAFAPPPPLPEGANDDEPELDFAPPDPLEPDGPPAQPLGIASFDDVTFIDGDEPEADETEMAESVADEAPEPLAPALHGFSALSTLSADIGLGRVRIVMLSSLGRSRDNDAVGDSLVADALHRGLSVCRVDAGSAQPSEEAGISDLAADTASFGDVVHKAGIEGLAFVPWGREAAMDRRSSKPVTLADALTEIYDLVLVNTGRAGMTSSLPVFAGIDCRLVLVAKEPVGQGVVENALADAEDFGFLHIQLVEPPRQRAEVA